jgi:predicted DNA binding CopG/RHH family protein
MLNVRVTDEEIEMLKEIAERHGLNQSDAVRQLIRREHAETSTKSKRRKTTTKKR